jgi:preprotein translocase subunit SecA
MLSNRLSRRTNDRDRRSMQRSRPLLDVPPIREHVKSLQSLTDSQLRSAFEGVRSRCASQEVEEEDYTSVFALATEAVRRSTGKTYYDVQLQAGEVLARGDLAEMATGEGKTLVTLLPVIAAIARGDQVHVATTNSYLANRDSEELRPALELLGISFGLLPEENDEAAKRTAYKCEVTFGTGYEFGFDYLRDQLTLRQQPVDRLGDSWLRSLAQQERPEPSLVQPYRQVSIVDEIDSVLIDEANTPLVISFFTGEEIDATPYRRAASVAKQLVDRIDYDVDSAAHRITVTQSGLDRIKNAFANSGSSPLQRPWRIYVEQALRAQYLLHRDIDYIIQDGAVALVDQHTGRIFPERKWRDGLHQAIELREGVALTPETNSFARISRQRFFKIYERGTGMTGTATDAAAELNSFFGLSVVPIPLNRPSLREVLPARYFAHGDAKYRAIVDDTRRRCQAGQPVLIGTRTVEQSRIIASLLESAGVSHQTLNGTQNADEASIVAQAGTLGAVTVATNMAGRGTDIKLSRESREAGGLHVIAAEPNRSYRVDRQLVGRCARQGDPGSCQTFVAADDELLEHVGEPLAKRIVKTADRSGEATINKDAVLREIQRNAEQIDFARRQHLMQQELWVESVLDTLVGAR